MAVTRVNISELTRHLSRCLRRLQEGDTILLCRRNVPVAQIRPVAPERREPRRIGILRGELEVPDSFFGPLPDDLLDGFEGK
jgi:antitoxin (DNA-binding transcriptional repressor) of toxin-antitoxin stability system